MSLSQSLRVRGGLGNGLLASVISRLREGCTLTTLLEGVEIEAQPEIESIVQELLTRGLLEKADEIFEVFSTEENAYYGEQVKFFSNFRRYGDRPPAQGATTKDAAEDFSLQARLKQSSVMIVGLGCAGLRLVRNLAKAGVGHVHGSDSRPVTARDVMLNGYLAGHAQSSRQDAARHLIAAENRYIQYSACRADLISGDSDDFPENLDLLILADEHFDPDFYGQTNHICLERKLKWTSCRQLGLRYEVGPTIVPFETACFRCLELRKAANVTFYEEFLTNQRQLVAGHYTLGSLNFELGCEVLALEIIKLLTGFSRPLTYSSIYSFDLVSMESRIHPVLKLPRCPACGPSRNRPSFTIWRPSTDFGGL